MIDETVTIEEAAETELETPAASSSENQSSTPEAVSDDIEQGISELESVEDIDSTTSGDETVETDSDGDEVSATSSIQYIIVTVAAETQTQADYSLTLLSIDDKLDTIVSCSIVVMAVVVLSWIHLISRRRRNQK